MKPYKDMTVVNQQALITSQVKGNNMLSAKNLRGEIQSITSRQKLLAEMSQDEMVFTDGINKVHQSVDLGTAMNQGSTQMDSIIRSKMTNNQSPQGTVHASSSLLKKSRETRQQYLEMPATQSRSLINKSYGPSTQSL